MANHVEIEQDTMCSRIRQEYSIGTPINKLRLPTLLSNISTIGKNPFKAYSKG